jgi:hypothetical protein
LRVALQVGPVVTAMAPAPAMHLIAIAALVAFVAAAAVRTVIVLRLRTTGYERRQAFAISISAVARLVRLLMVLWRLLMRLAGLMLLMLRPMLLVRLLFAIDEWLRFARRIWVAFARGIRRLVAAKTRLSLRRLANALFGIVECLVAHFLLRPIIGILLAELFLSRCDQTEIMLGVLMVILGGNGVAGRHRITGQLHVFLGDMGRRAPDFHFRTV